jgi:hypothetical protein
VRNGPIGVLVREATQPTVDPKPPIMPAVARALVREAVTRQPRAPSPGWGEGSGPCVTAERLGDSANLSAHQLWMGVRRRQRTSRWS